MEIGEKLASEKEILVSMGSQLKARGGLLFKRVAYILWPVLFGIGFLFLGNKLQALGYFVKDSPSFYWGIIFLIFWGIFSIIWGTVTRIIFSVEKRIWIDSHFDGVTLTGEESWRIARKMFWPVVKMNFFLFFRFYLFPIAVYLGIIVSFFFLPKIHWSVYVLVVFGGPVVLWFYFYYLGIKLRFVWFLFLDLFGEESFSFGRVIEEMKKCNRMSSSESFQKSLLVILGTDAVNEIVQTAVGLIGRGFGSIGETGKFFGSIFRVFGEEASNQVASFAKMAGIYILYKQVVKEVWGSEKVINRAVYDLK